MDGEEEVPSFIEEFKEHGYRIRQATEADRVDLHEFLKTHILIKTENKIFRYKSFEVFESAESFRKCYTYLLVDRKDKIQACLGLEPKFGDEIPNIPGIIESKGPPPKVF